MSHAHPRRPDLASHALPGFRFGGDVLRRAVIWMGDGTGSEPPRAGYPGRRHRFLDRLQPRRGETEVLSRAPAPSCAFTRATALAVRLAPYFAGSTRPRGKCLPPYEDASRENRYP